ncbi:MAG: hypothetical protein WAZ18_01570 [Alphaproteobacteria bacterium]
MDRSTPLPNIFGETPDAREDAVLDAVRGTLGVMGEQRFYAKARNEPDTLSHTEEPRTFMAERLKLLP